MCECVTGGEAGRTPPPVTPSPQELRERVLRGKYRVPFYMSTDCESILRRFLVLNPAKRCTLEVSRPHTPRVPSCPAPVLSPTHLLRSSARGGGSQAAQGKAPRPILMHPPTQQPRPLPATPVIS